MIDKYQKEFDEMHQEVIGGKKPLEVIRNYVPVFEEKGEDIGHLGLIDYFSRYLKER